LKKIIIICGPTATGKTAVGIWLAKQFNGEIVSADSQQVWRGFDVGTAKANLTERSEVRHHLIDVCEPTQHFDSEFFLKLADAAIADIVSRGKTPFVVGGTGMYLKMLERGICDAPPGDDQFRGALEKELDAGNIWELHERLRMLDPDAAKDIHPNDRTRIVRALEIQHLTGVPASEFRRRHDFSEKRYDALKIGLELDRKELYERINDRVDTMMGDGLLNEVRELLEKYGPNCQPFRAVGYREFVAYLKGEMRYEEALEETKKQSRRFAKRQMTWFRADPEIEWFAPADRHEISSVCARHL
jgi:tRNA dimethylallyltransferase